MIVFPYPYKEYSIAMCSLMLVCYDDYFYKEMCAPDISSETGWAAKNPFNTALGNVERGGGENPLENLGFIPTQFRWARFFVA